MSTFSVLSWNVQGKINFTGHTFFRKIKRELLTESADIIALQELPNAHRKLKFFKNYNLFISNLNKNLSSKKEGYNHNVILSKYPIMETEEIIFPNFSKKIRLENCVRIKILVDNHELTIYNCHFPIFRAGPEVRIKQLEFLLSHSLNNSNPVIVCGDMNVSVPKNKLSKKIISLIHQQPKDELPLNSLLEEFEEKKVFQKMAEKYGFRDVLGIQIPTWSPFKSKLLEPFKLKLDWFLTKNLEVAGVELGDYISDHRSIKTHCQIT